MRKIPHRFVTRFWTQEESDQYGPYLQPNTMAVFWKMGENRYHTYIEFTEDVPRWRMLRELIESKHFIIEQHDLKEYNRRPIQQHKTKSKTPNYRRYP